MYQQAFVYTSYVFLAQGCSVVRRPNSPNLGPSYYVWTSYGGSAEHRQQSICAFLACVKSKEMRTVAFSHNRCVISCLWQVKSLIALVQQMSTPGFTFIPALWIWSVCQDRGGPWRMIRRLGHLSCEGWLRELCLFSLEKRGSGNTLQQSSST